MSDPLMISATHQYSYPRGSEWRKWDLQVHTPFSALNNGYGNDFSAYAKKLLEKAIKNQVAALGLGWSRAFVPQPSLPGDCLKSSSFHPWVG